MSAGHAFQRVIEIGEGLDLVELGGSDERADGCPSGAAAVGSGKQVVLAAERDRADDALDRIGIEFDAAVIEEAAKCAPADQGIADRIGQTAAGRGKSELRIEPGLHRRDSGSDLDWRTLCRAAAVWPRIVVSIA